MWREEVCRRHKTKSSVVASLIVSAATPETGERTADRTDAGERGAALRAGVEIFAGSSAASKGQIVTTGFVWNPEITTGLPPF